MLRYLYGDQLCNYPKLADRMFRDRAAQFRKRLGWDVTVDHRGWERDEYDNFNPLYVIWENEDGSHGGSMRFLPTTGQTMVNDHFIDLMEGVELQSPFIWECTRFCLNPSAESRVAAALMLAGGELMRAFDVRHFVGVFDARMVRIYRMIGSAPEILGQSGKGRDMIAVGLWGYDDRTRERVAYRAGIPPELSEKWFLKSFGFEPRLQLVA
ncbi:acyl-homoserine-lactone synthase [Marivivens sp.]|uniref:acyl-homoserine-lactone synthase n=1 Tax=Marivivens sp. TaxID=1978374 RepID=UPI0025C62E0A|nr:acyl-homoserine-lactone synthase [Marivivens sp.]